MGEIPEWRIYCVADPRRHGRWRHDLRSEPATVDDAVTSASFPVPHFSVVILASQFQNCCTTSAEAACDAARPIRGPVDSPSHHFGGADAAGRRGAAHCGPRQRLEREGSAREALSAYDLAIDAARAHRPSAQLADILRWKGTLLRELGDPWPPNRCTRAVSRSRGAAVRRRHRERAELSRDRGAAPRRREAGAAPLRRGGVERRARG